MIVRRYMLSMLAIAMLIMVGGSTFAGTHVTVDGTTDESTVTAASTPPSIEIVVYDGTTLPATVVAGCSEPDCMGYSGPVTGTVTHLKNYVGWSIAFGEPPVKLYVDGELVYTTRKMSLLLFNTRNLSAGPHTLVATAGNKAGLEGSSTPLVITVVK